MIQSYHLYSYHLFLARCLKKKQIYNQIFSDKKILGTNISWKGYFLNRIIPEKDGSWTGKHPEKDNIC